MVNRGALVEYEDYEHMTKPEYLDAMSTTIKLVRLGCVFCLSIFLLVFIYETSFSSGSHTFMSIVNGLERQSHAFGESFYAFVDGGNGLKLPLDKEEYKRVAAGDTVFVTLGDVTSKAVRATLYHEGYPVFVDRNLRVSDFVWAVIFILFTALTFLPRRILTRLQLFHLHCTMRTFEYLTYGFLIYIGYMLGFF